MESDMQAAGQKYRIVTARGGLDLATSAVLRFDLAGWGPDEGAPRLIVDLGQAASLDAAALGILCTALAKAEHRGGWVRLVHAQHHVALLLSAACLDARFPRYANIADALADRTSP